nr:hypothetical protein [Actinomadura fibrosa]
MIPRKPLPPGPIRSGAVLRTAPRFPVGAVARGTPSRNRVSVFAVPSRTPATCVNASVGRPVSACSVTGGSVPSDTASRTLRATPRPKSPTDSVQPAPVPPGAGCLKRIWPSFPDGSGRTKHSNVAPPDAGTSNAGSIATSTAASSDANANPVPYRPGAPGSTVPLRVPGCPVRPGYRPVTSCAGPAVSSRW